MDMSAAIMNVGQFGVDALVGRVRRGNNPVCPWPLGVLENHGEHRALDLSPAGSSGRLHNPFANSSAP
jgi:hypothetical protein